MPAPSSSAIELSDEQIEQYDQNGFLVVPGYLPANDVAEIRDAFMEQAKDGPVAGLSDTSRLLGPADPLSRYPRMMNPHRAADTLVGPLARRHMLAPRLGRILADLMRDEPLAAQSMFYFKPPGARGQDFHQDNFYLRVKPGNCMAAWIAVDESDQGNGAMVVVPSSHNMDIACPEAADPKLFFSTEHVPVPAGFSKQMLSMNAGDILFFNGSIIHGSYPNHSPDRFRRSLIFHYIPATAHEVANFYKPLLRFDGTAIDKETAVGGGPCGELQRLPTYPH